MVEHDIVHEGELLTATRDWLLEHAGEMAYVFRLYPPKLTGFPNPGTSMWKMLELLEANPVGLRVKQMVLPLGEEEENLREMLRVYCQKNIVSRHGVGLFRLGPHGWFWLSFHRMLGTKGGPS